MTTDYMSARGTGLRICIVDDELEHRVCLRELLSDALPAASQQAGTPLESSSITITLFDNSLDVLKLIEASKDAARPFPFDVLVADVFMPMDPGSDREHPYGGAVRIYDGVKASGLQDQIIMLIVSKDISGAEDALAKISGEQRELEFQWAFTFSKPGFLCARPSDPGDAWASVVADVIAHRNDQEYRKRNALRLPAGELVATSFFESARMEVEALLARGPCAFMLITGERGTGKEILAKYLAQRTGRSGHVTQLMLSGEGSEETLVVRLFGRELTDPPREGLLERQADGVVFIDNFALRSEKRDLLDQRLLALLLSMKNDQRCIGEFFRLDGVDAKRFSGTVILSCERLDTLRKNLDIPRALIELMVDRTVNLPPLRQASDSIVPLARYYLKAAGKQQRLDGDAIKLLKSYHWPANIKELEDKITVIAAEVAENGWITAGDLRRAGVIPGGPASQTLIVRANRALRMVRGSSASIVAKLWRRYANRKAIWAAAGAMGLFIVTGVAHKFLDKLSDDPATTYAERLRDFVGAKRDATAEQTVLPQSKEPRNKGLR